VSQLLTEIDGLENLEDVMVIATSNRPELIDNALLRPGRIDRQIYIPVPDSEARVEILNVHTQDKPLADDVDLEQIAQQTDGFVGADLEALCRTATMNATRKYLNQIADEDIDGTQVTVTMSDFTDALDQVHPSVTAEMREAYENIEVSMKGGDEQQNTNTRVAFQ
jgi:transitional endoplasmic reticulum ATPase